MRRQFEGGLNRRVCGGSSCEQYDMPEQNDSRGSCGVLIYVMQLSLLLYTELVGCIYVDSKSKAVCLAVRVPVCLSARHHHLWESDPLISRVPFQRLPAHLHSPRMDGDPRRAQEKVKMVSKHRGVLLSESADRSAQGSQERYSSAVSSFFHP